MVLFQTFLRPYKFVVPVILSNQHAIVLRLNRRTSQLGGHYANQTGTDRREDGPSVVAVDGDLDDSFDDLMQLDNSPGTHQITTFDQNYNGVIT